LQERGELVEVAALLLQTGQQELQDMHCLIVSHDPLGEVRGLPVGMGLAELDLIQTTRQLMRCILGI
jgi:hypothetical protein